MTELWSGPWIDSPFFEETLKTKSLSVEDEKLVREFHSTGFLTLPGLIDAESADLLVDEVHPNYTSITGRHQDLWKKSPRVRTLSLNEKIKNVLKLLYGRAPIAFQTLNFKYGTEQRTHSDFIHFSSLPEGYMCGVWVALEDVGATNGPLHYYSGSHRLPLYDYHQIGIRGPITDYSHYEDFIAKVAENSKCTRVEVKAKKGDAFIWAANLLHGGSPILAQGSTRWSQVTHYFFENCVYYTPMHSNRVTGELCLRTPINIETQQPTVGSYNGQPLSVFSYPGNISRIGFGNTTPVWWSDLLNRVDFSRPPEATP